MSEDFVPRTRDASAAPTPLAVPYEKTLDAAFKRLTDQVLVFLLAYVILLIGTSVFASAITTELRILLYIIPILGVAAYLLQRRRGLSATARGRDLRVRSGIAAGAGTYVGGERGAGHATGTTETTSLVAAGGATVIGRDVPRSTDVEAPRPVEAQYLMQIFQQLDGTNQRKLIGTAQNLLNHQKIPDG